MPAYEYTCICGIVETLMRSIDKRDAPVRCAACGEPMQRSLAAPAAHVAGTPRFHKVPAK
jgi:putative FmdB family regulatory protein